MVFFGLIELASQSHPADPGLITGTVTRVIDGDTIVVKTKKISGTLPKDTGAIKSEETVRYIGVNAPELGRDDRAPACFSVRAQDQNEFLVLGKEVTLQMDVEGRDRFGRLLAYVFIGDLAKEELVQDRLIDGGFGWVMAVGSNVWRTRRFLGIQRESIRSQAGLWSACGPAPDIESIVISEIQFSGDDEILTLINRSASHFDLSQWKLVSLPGQVFTFPSGCSIASGSRLRVHTGPKADKSAKDCAKGDLFWTMSWTWNNDGDTAILQTPQGIVAEFFEYRGGHASTHSGH
jgi:micrococcal nuclease